MKHLIITAMLVLGTALAHAQSEAPVLNKKGAQVGYLTEAGTVQLTVNLDQKGLKKLRKQHTSILPTTKSTYNVDHQIAWHRSEQRRLRTGGWIMTGVGGTFLFVFPLATVPVTIVGIVKVVNGTKHKNKADNLQMTRIQ